MADQDRPKQIEIPIGFLRFSEAANRLAEGMWGGLPRPTPVGRIKLVARDLSVGFGPWQEEARQRLTRAAVDGELLVYVLGMGPAPTVVPRSVLTVLPKSRGGLIDVHSRVNVRAVLDAMDSERLHASEAEGNKAGENIGLFRKLTTWHLVVSETGFLTWYQAERSKGKWASQRSRSKARGGRPTKQTEQLKSSILAHVHDGSWRGDRPITDLHRLLIDDGVCVSPDTLKRLVDRVFTETGEPGLRTKRRRPKGK